MHDLVTKHRVSCDRVHRDPVCPVCCQDQDDVVCPLNRVVCHCLLPGEVGRRVRSVYQTRPVRANRIEVNFRNLLICQDQIQNRAKDRCVKSRGQIHRIVRGSDHDRRGRSLTDHHVHDHHRGHDYHRALVIDLHHHDPEVPAGLVARRGHRRRFALRCWLSLRHRQQHATRQQQRSSG